MQVNAKVLSSIPISFPRPGNEAKRHSRIRRKVGNGNVLIETECPNTRFPLPIILLSARYGVKEPFHIFYQSSVTFRNN